MLEASPLAHEKRSARFRRPAPRRRCHTRRRRRRRRRLRRGVRAARSKNHPLRIAVEILNCTSELGERPASVGRNLGRALVEIVGKRAHGPGSVEQLVLYIACSHTFQASHDPVELLGVTTKRIGEAFDIGRVA